MKTRFAAIAAAAGLALALPDVAAACDNCLAAQDDAVQAAFAIASVFLSVTPLGMIAGFVWWLRRRTQKIQAEEAAGVIRLPLASARGYRRRRLVALAAALALACGRQGTYEVHGLVREVDYTAKQATIEHEDIPGLMSAMTMGFDVPDPAVLAKLQPGERIVFELEVTEKSFRIVSVRNADEAVPRAGASRAASGASVARAGDLAPDYTLTDQNGARVSSASLRGRWAVVDFVYTRCTGPCPILTSLQVELQKKLAPALGEKVHFVSITLDPEFDTPAVLGDYARARGADLANWSFLTGPPDEVADVVKRFGVGTLRSADGQIDHVVATFLVDPQGRIEQRWLGLENGAEERRAEIAELAGAPAAGS